jgi:ubiquinone/menaquinone biosynthesis C-methylase UbiE
MNVEAGATYDAAADHYDDPANTFWDRFGGATVERLGLDRGDRVLDACCGSGASALPAAERVGPAGFVLGVDLAEELLVLARRKAAARGLRQVEFRRADLLDLRLPVGEFDAVICVFGLFFVPDMPAAVRCLWGLLRRGGRLAVTTWGPRFFEPANTAFWNAVRAERPDLDKGFHPWDRIVEPEALREVLLAGGAVGPEVSAVAGLHSIPSPEAWWAAVMGSGYRGTVERLGGEARARVRDANLEYVRRSGLDAVEANVVYAIASKP